MVWWTPSSVVTRDFRGCKLAPGSWVEEEKKAAEVLLASLLLTIIAATLAFAVQIVALLRRRRKLFDNIITLFLFWPYVVRSWIWLLLLSLLKKQLEKESS